jgi:hypothetical protein
MAIHMFAEKLVTGARAVERAALKPTQPFY